MERIKFLNTYVDNMTMEEAVQEIDKLVGNKVPSYAVTPNMDHIVTIEEDKIFEEIYRKADLVAVDGKPLIWLSRILGNPIKEKISGSDLFPEICKLAAKKNYSIFILGAKEGVADLAASKLRNKFKGLNIVGTYSPTIGFENNDEELTVIKNMLKNSLPDILAVALGSPKGEKFIYKHLNEYDIPFSISIGATIDFEAGNVKRAPKWISNLGFEWLYRITQDPKRMIKRYVIDMYKIGPIIRRYGGRK